MFLCFYGCMRTTIDLPDSLFRRVKAAASMKGLTLKKFITRAIEREIETQKAAFERQKQISFPLVPSRHPGSLQIDGNMVAEALEKEDYNVSS